MSDKLNNWYLEVTKDIVSPLKKDETKNHIKFLLKDYDEDKVLELLGSPKDYIKKIKDEELKDANKSRKSMLIVGIVLIFISLIVLYLPLKQLFVYRVQELNTNNFIFGSQIGGALACGTICLVAGITLLISLHKK